MGDLIRAGELVRSFRAALKVPLLSHPPGTQRYDLYEVYLYALAIEAARSARMEVSFEDTSGIQVSALRLRTAPSTIWSNVQDFTHATLTAPNGRQLEAHLGIYLKGSSGVSHEGDIVILDAREAAAARARQVDPSARSAAVVLEAKFHSSDVRLRFGREFLGLASDIRGDRAIFVSSSPGLKVQRLLKARRPGHFEVTPGSVGESQLKGLIGHRLETYVA